MLNMLSLSLSCQNLDFDSQNYVKKFKYYRELVLESKLETFSCGVVNWEKIENGENFVG